MPFAQLGKFAQYGSFSPQQLYHEHGFVVPLSRTKSNMPSLSSFFQRRMLFFLSRGKWSFRERHCLNREWVMPRVTTNKVVENKCFVSATGSVVPVSMSAHGVA